MIKTTQPALNKYCLLLPGIIWEPGDFLHAAGVGVQAHDDVVRGAPHVPTHLLVHRMDLSIGQSFSFPCFRVIGINMCSEVSLN
jgi:hypothetical protein